MIHEISVIPKPKMDTPVGLFTWTCTCGKTSEMVGSERQARLAGEHHKAAKETQRYNEVAERNGWR